MYNKLDNDRKKQYSEKAERPLRVKAIRTTFQYVRYR